MKAESLHRKIQRKGIDDRLYFDRHKLTNEQYHLCHKAVSSSALKDLYQTKNPYYCYQKYIKRTLQHNQSDAMLIGSATHSLILEPRTFNKYFAIWHGARKAGKEWNEFKQFNDDKDIITQAQYDNIQTMREAVAKNTEASKLLSGGEAEQSVFWRDDETDLLCRARADYVKETNGSKIIVDLKTTVSAEPIKFTKDLINLMYPIQECMYRHGFKADAFAFVVVEKVTNTVQVYTLDDLFDDTGHYLYRMMLEKWKEHLDSGIWPTYKTGVHQLSAPTWWADKILYEETE